MQMTSRVGNFDIKYRVGLGMSNSGDYAKWIN